MVVFAVVIHAGDLSDQHRAFSFFAIKLMIKQQADVIKIAGAEIREIPAETPGFDFPGFVAILLPKLKAFD